jgi:hypothetical protein
MYEKRRGDLYSIHGAYPKPRGGAAGAEGEPKL